MTLREPNNTLEKKKGGRPPATPQVKMEKFLASFSDEERAELEGAAGAPVPDGPTSPLMTQPRTAVSLPEEDFGKLPAFMVEQRAGVLVAPGSTYSAQVYGWETTLGAGNVPVNTKTSHGVKLTGSVTPAKLVEGMKHPNQEYQQMLDSKENPGQSNRIIVKRTARGRLQGCALRVDDQYARRVCHMSLEELVYKLMTYCAYGDCFCFIEDEEAFARIQNKFSVADTQMMEDFVNMQVFIAESGQVISG